MSEINPQELFDAANKEFKEQLLCLHCWKESFDSCYIKISESPFSTLNYPEVYIHILICINCGSIFSKKYLKPKTPLEQQMKFLGI